MIPLIKMQQKHYSVPNIQYNVPIVGAGLYSPTSAAYLSYQELNTIVFGKPMPLWHVLMPPGMLLRSYWRATNVSDLKKESESDQFCLIIGQLERISSNRAREAVIDSGLQFYQQAIPNAGQTYMRITTLLDLGYPDRWTFR